MRAETPVRFKCLQFRHVVASLGFGGNQMKVIPFFAIQEDTGPRNLTASRKSSGKKSSKKSSAKKSSRKKR